MSSITNIINTDSNQSVIKGFFYKIKNDANQTVGHLFGTVHHFDQKDASLLHKKVFKELSNSQKLFLEVNIFDENLLASKLKKCPDASESKTIRLCSEQNNISSEQAIQKIAKESVTLLRENSTSIEAVLALQAEKCGIEVHSLETAESRDKAFQSIQDELDYLELKRQFIVAYCTKECIDQLNQLNQNLVKNLDPKAALKNLLEGFECLKEALLNIDFSKVNSSIADHNLLLKLDELFNTFDQLFKLFGLETGIMEELKLLYNVRKIKDNLLLTEAIAIWKSGCEQEIEKIASYETPVESKFQEISNKMLYLRDETMLERMHDELQLSSKKTRNFYAVGSMHLIGNYENIIKRLEKKGWKIVNAYKTT